MATYVFPVAGSYKITSGFGIRDAPTAGASTTHPGIDISVPVGTPVLSAMAGIVSGGGYSDARGNYLVVDHGSGITTLYQHLSKALVRVGDTVSAGQQIALSGNSGISTGAHLHYEVRKDGQVIDPLKFSGLGSDLNLGGDLMARINTDGIIDFLKSYWWMVAGALVVLAVLK